MRFHIHRMHGTDALSWHRQKGQALASARAHAKTVPKGEAIEVERVTLAEIPTKELVFIILSDGEFIAERETIASVEGQMGTTPPLPKTKKKKTKKKKKKTSPKKGTVPTPKPKPRPKGRPKPPPPPPPKKPKKGKPEYEW